MCLCVFVLCSSTRSSMMMMMHMIDDERVISANLLAIFLLF